MICCPDGQDQHVGAASGVFIMMTTEITTATTLYRELSMTYWLGPAETFT
jgi:hypothetical protein